MAVISEPKSKLMASNLRFHELLSRSKNRYTGPRTGPRKAKGASDFSLTP